MTIIGKVTFLSSLMLFGGCLDKSEDRFTLENRMRVSIKKSDGTPNHYSQCPEWGYGRESRVEINGYYYPAKEETCLSNPSIKRYEVKTEVGNGVTLKTHLYPLSPTEEHFNNGIFPHDNSLDKL